MEYVLSIFEKLQYFPTDWEAFGKFTKTKRKFKFLTSFISCIKLLPHLKSIFTLEISDGKLCNYTTDFGGCTNCSANGGQGVQTRTTTCNCPPPSNGGANCTSSGLPNTTLSSDSSTETQTRACTTCPVGRLFKIPFQ